MFFLKRKEWKLVKLQNFHYLLYLIILRLWFPKFQWFRAKKIPWDFPHILAFSKFPWGAQQFPWDFPDFPGKSYFAEISRTRGTLLNTVL